VGKEWIALKVPNWIAYSTNKTVMTHACVYVIAGQQHCLETRQTVKQRLVPVM